MVILLLLLLLLFCYLLCRYDVKGTFDLEVLKETVDAFVELGQYKCPSFF